MRNRSHILAVKSLRYWAKTARERPEIAEWNLEEFTEFSQEVEKAIEVVASQEVIEEWNTFMPLSLMEFDDVTFEMQNSFQRVFERGLDWLDLFIQEIDPPPNPFISGGENIQSVQSVATRQEIRENRVFIGHGRSHLWRELKDFIQDSLNLDWEEFNREATAGLSITERLTEMLSAAEFAFLIMTAEDEHSDGCFHARENVIHEVGLFQGKLGFRRAIVLLEEGCKEFSNIHGLNQIRFPKGQILAKSEEIRGVLKREGMLKQGQ